MVYIYDRDFGGNPINRKYVFLAGHLDADWKVVRDMYESISDKDRVLVDQHIIALQRQDNRKYLEMLCRTENLHSRVLIPTKYKQFIIPLLQG
ncbi:hypothetical protein J4477_02885 [Candidatus Pacearchaeota archaeon]|nr:hypothetical protein [Candidatus Pacearchaeota archaeon]